VATGRSGSTSAARVRYGLLRGAAVLAAGAPALLALPGAALASPAAVGPPSGDPVVVSLGDSYISGTAGRWAGNSDDFLFDRGGTDRAWSRSSDEFFGDSDRSVVYGSTADSGCFRSDSAPIASAVEVAGLELGRPVNLACSGAKAANVLRASEGGVGKGGQAPQNDQLADLARTSRVNLIVLSVGGNDLSFPELVFSCIRAYTLRRDPCRDAQADRVREDLPAMGAAVGAVLDDVRATMREAGYADDDYRLILQSYPTPLPTADEDKYEGHWRVFKWTGGRCPFTDTDMTWAAEGLTEQVASTLARTAARHDTSFLDLTAAFDGHELCAEGTTHPHGDPSAAEVEWVRFVDYTGQGDYAESLHPNYFGQQAIGWCIAAAAARAGDSTCTADPDAGLAGMELKPR